MGKAEVVQVIQSIRVQLFAGAKEACGHGAIDVVIPFDTIGPEARELSIASLKAAMINQYPTLQPFVEYARIAIGHSFVDDTDVASIESLAMSAVALIPPVSGG